MLILTRKEGEKVDVRGNDVEGSVTVVSIKGNTVRLGFDFPFEVAVRRREVTLRIEEDNEEDAA